MTRPLITTDPPLRMLDLFSGAGGCARGYQQAGFEVTGVDLHPQPRYAGDHFVLGDALEYLATADLTGVDAIHASPPCQAYAGVTAWRGNRDNHPDLLAATRTALKAAGLPYVVENVEAAAMPGSLVLCGTAVGRPHPSHEGAEQPMSDQPTNRVDVTTINDGAFVLVGDTDGGGTTMIDRRAWDAFLAAERAIGYDRAVVNLLDRAMFSEWFASVARNPDVYLSEGARQTAVAYLEAVKETPDHA